MKKILILKIVFLLPIFTFSQKGLIKYGYVESFGLGNAKGEDLNSYLVFNKDKSYFVSNKDSLEINNPKDSNKPKQDDDENIKTIKMGSSTSAEGDQVVIDLNKKTMWSSIFFKDKQVYIKEITPKIDWKIGKETKKIGKFSCKKATANFRGRDYIVWFTIEIPLPFGPWKLNGLPGLILEAYDTDKYVFWYYKSVDYPSKTKEDFRYMKIPLNKKIKNYTEFKNFQKEQIDLASDKIKLVKKQYPNVEFFPPKINETFIECE